MAKILIIEDDRTIAKPLQAILQHEGDEVCLSLRGSLDALDETYERLLAEGDHARVSGDAPILYALATRYLSLARQHYRAGRCSQAAKAATAITRLADAIRHLSWAAGTN